MDWKTELAREEKKQLAIAYHEAGHVVAHYWFKIPFKAVTIKPHILECKDLRGIVLTGNSALRVPSRKRKESPIFKEKCFRHVLISLVGAIAHARFLGKPLNFEEIKKYRSTDFTGAIVWAGNALPISDMPKGKERTAFLKWVFLRAKRLFMWSDPWKCIKAVAKKLNEEYTLTEPEVKKICKEILGW